MTILNMYPANMHPDSGRTCSAGIASDYPVQLITKRIFGLSEQQILKLREQAPKRISISQYGLNPKRPPC